MESLNITKAKTESERQPTPLNGLPIHSLLLRESRVVDSHSGDGDYGTTEFNNIMSRMTSLYIQYAHQLGVANPRKIQSQAVSLSLGGLFDIDDDWDVPHCGHRNGVAIDLSYTRLSAHEQSALQRAAKVIKLEFRVAGEKPGNAKDHWHGQIYK